MARFRRLKRFLTLSLPAFVVMVVALEFFFARICPSAEHPFYRMSTSGDLHIGKYTRENGETGVKTIGPLCNHPAVWRINNQGWNSEIDYPFERKPEKWRIAVIGDSYVEALNVDVGKSFTDRIRAVVDSTEFYSFGIGGSPLSQYLQFMEYASENFNPDAFIVLVTLNDFDESLVGKGDNRNRLVYFYPNGQIIEVPPEFYETPTGRFRRLAQRSALMRYLYYNLQLARLTRWVRLDMEKDRRVAEHKKRLREDNQHTSDGNFASFDSLPPEMPFPSAVPGKIKPGPIELSGEQLGQLARFLTNRFEQVAEGRPVLFLVDGDREAIYKHDSRQEDFAAATDTLAYWCRERGFGFIDLHPVFQNEYVREGRKFNNGVDYHWDEYGHAVVADTLRAYFLERFRQQIREATTQP